MRWVLLALVVAGVVALVSLLWWSGERGAKSQDTASAAPADEAQTHAEAMSLVDAQRDRASLVASVEKTLRVDESTLRGEDAALKPVATLVVRVEAGTTGRALAGAEVWGYGTNAYGSKVSRDDAPHELERHVITDVDGMVEIECPISMPIRLQAHGGNDAGFIEQDVTALSPGERRKITLRLPTEPDLTFYGVVLSRADRFPIAGARVGVYSLTDAASTVTTRGDGSFDVLVPSWKSPFAKIRADGHAEVVGHIRAGHSTAATAQEFLLSRAATLTLRITGAGDAAFAGIEAKLTCHAYHVEQPSRIDFGRMNLGDPEWKATTDFEGRTEIGKLPPDVPLQMTLSRGGNVLRIESKPIVLDAGEIRELDIRLDQGRVIHGRITDEAGAVVVAREVWLVAASEKGLHYLNEDMDKPVAKATSGADGAYVFSDVPAGEWWVGGSPPLDARNATSSSDWLARFVEMTADEVQEQVDLDVHRSLFVGGRLVDPHDKPIEGYVMMRSDSAHGVLTTRTESDGAFRFGPVAPGSFTVSAHVFGEFADPDPLSCAAGDAGLVLRANVAGVIHGRVVDAGTNAGVSAELWVTSADHDGLETWGVRSAEDGTFAHDSLVPGAYRVSASTTDGRFGGSPIVIVKADASTETRIVVSPGARIRAIYRGPQRVANVQLVADGVRIGGDGAAAGAPMEKTVPAGRVQIRWYEGAKFVHENLVDVQVGETQEVVYRGGE